MALRHIRLCASLAVGWLVVIYIAFPRPERIAIYVELLLIIFATQVKQRI
jgi:hypothetical protein